MYVPLLLMYISFVFTELSVHKQSLYGNMRPDINQDYTVQCRPDNFVPAVIQMVGPCVASSKLS